MPLSTSAYNIVNMTQAINVLPNTPTLLADLNLFTPSYQATTYVQIERRDGQLSLVENRPRGAVGDPVKDYQGTPKTFNMLHFVKDDIVRADDVQNLRAFGSITQAQSVAQLVNDKLAMMKADIDYTREHAMLGALKGKILDSNGTTVLTDIYKEFGLSRTEYNWQLSSDKTDVGILIDQYKIAFAKLKKGEMTNGLIALCSPNFMEKLISHKSIKELYLRHQDGKIYREGSTDVEFIHKGIRFMVYADEFASGLKVGDDEAIILPTGTRNVFREYFAPADMNATVNTKALAYYASREKLPHDKGWSLHAQSNPLALVLRPELVATLKLS